MKCEFGSEKERRKNSSKLSIPNSEFNFLEAAELARLSRARELSAKETMAACIEQIERIVTT